jgi:sec-independent protein translocase protein TatB
MFGMGFTEILVIGIIAVIFLGPDKLPQALVEIAKFFKSVKGTVASAKESLESELDVSGIKESIQAHKSEFLQASSELQSLTDLSEIKTEIGDIKNSAKVDLNKEAEKTTPPVSAPEVVTFTKKTKKEDNL